MANEKIICDRQDLVAIADAIREKTGSIDGMTLGEIATNISRLEVGSSSGSSNNKTISISVDAKGYEVYGFDANGNSLSVSNGTYDFLYGIVGFSGYNISLSGDYIRNNMICMFLADGGKIINEESTDPT